MSKKRAFWGGLLPRELVTEYLLRLAEVMPGQWGLCECMYYYMMYLYLTDIWAFLELLRCFRWCEKYPKSSTLLGESNLTCKTKRSWHRQNALIRGWLVWFRLSRAMWTCKCLPLNIVLHVTGECVMASMKPRLFSGLSDLASASFYAVISCNIQSYKPILQLKPLYMLFLKYESSV